MTRKIRQNELFSIEFMKTKYFGTFGRKIREIEMIFDVYKKTRKFVKTKFFKNEQKTIPILFLKA